MTCHEAYKLWYERSPRGKRARARYRLSLKGQASAQRAYAKARAKYAASPEGQAARQRRLTKPPALTPKEKYARRNHSPAGRAATARYQDGPKFKAVRARYYVRVVKPRREREKAS
jgi:hypothetical protein